MDSASPTTTTHPPTHRRCRPPELITDGILTPAADVYAFGVLAWEVYLGRRAWDGLKPAEVLRKVANRTRLSFPPSTPHRLKVWGRAVHGSCKELLLWAIACNGALPSPQCRPGASHCVPATPHTTPFSL